MISPFVDLQALLAKKDAQANRSKSVALKNPTAQQSTGALKQHPSTKMQMSGVAGLEFMVQPKNDLDDFLMKEHAKALAAS